MRLIAPLRVLACFRMIWAEGRAWRKGGKRKGRDKSACHECRKSLMGLAFSRAYGSVVCRNTSFLKRLQRSDMHSAGLQFGGSVL
jgi:hypothetical protein